MEIYLNSFSKKFVTNFMKICPVGAVLFRVDRRTDVAELIVAFRNSANAPKVGHRRRISWRESDVLSVTGCYFTKLMVSLQNDK